MLKTLALAAGTLLLSANLLAADKPHVLLNTSQGAIEIELEADKAPISVKNFLAYVDSGYYNGTIFHRVIPNFMVQGGGFTPDMQQKATQPPIKNEADNGLRNGVARWPWPAPRRWTQPPVSSLSTAPTTTFSTTASATLATPCLPMWSKAWT